MRTTIETERLTLRPLALSDAKRVSAFTSDIDVARMVGSIPHPNPVAAAEGFIQIIRARAAMAKDYVYAIDLPGEGLIGVVGAHRKRANDMEIGYWIGRPYWGKGFATEAGRAVAGAALRLGPVTATHFVDNEASGRVLEKIGFAYTGEIEPRFAMARGCNVDARLMMLLAQDAAMRRRMGLHAS
ncbi:MAG: GNAT family N-acetyltransferase [Alphaproteobacteria bacterium]|nr:GNAT family N-acetyltransferase [Alphaproteobacteria bacterium]